MDLPRVATSLDRLDNGLRVITVELPHLHTAALCAFLRVGSRFEAPPDNGLSHFLEHMMFRGTRRLPSAYHINRAVEELGGTLYAETRRDASLYQITLPIDTVEPGLHLLGEVLREPAFTEIDVERRIILEEMQEDLDERGDDIHLGDLICASIWRGHPLSQKITGTLGNVKRFGPHDLHRHYEAHYGAQNLVLCVSGAARRGDVLRYAQAALGGLPAGCTHDIAPPPPMDDGPLRVHKDGDPGAQTSLSLAFRCFGEQDPDYPALGLLARILDDGMSTRLYQRLVNELGLAYYVGACLDLMVDTGVFELEATATHASVPRLVSEILGLCARLCEEPVPEDELAKAKRRYRWDMQGLHDEPGAMAEIFGRTELYYEPLPIAARLERVMALTAQDVMRAAQRVLRPAGLVVGSVGRMGGRIKQQVLSIVDDYKQ